jgi:hypothetical protein
MGKRIYLVVHDLDTYLIEANNKQQAIGHVARQSITATVASQMELVELIGAGAKVTKAGEVETETETED